MIGDLRCAGQPLVVAVPAGAEAARAWCEDMTCTVLLAKGQVLSAIQVAAGSGSRAAEAAKRLAPIAARKLPHPE